MVCVLNKQDIIEIANFPAHIFWNKKIYIPFNPNLIFPNVPNVPTGDVTVKYIRGLPHVIVPLPSRAEKCQFALRPITHNVGDFLQMLRAEDNGIDRAIILNADGVRIAAASTIESLLDTSFWYVFLCYIVIISIQLNS